MKTIEILQILPNLIAFITAAITAFRWYNKHQKDVYQQEQEIQYLKRQSQRLSRQSVDTDLKVDNLAATTHQIRLAVSLLVRESRERSNVVELPGFGKKKDSESKSNV